MPPADKRGLRILLAIALSPFILTGLLSGIVVNAFRSGYDFTREISL